MRHGYGFLAALGASLFLASAARSQVDAPAGTPDGADPAMTAPPDTPVPPNPSIPVQAYQPSTTAQPMPTQPAYVDPAISRTMAGGVMTYAAPAPFSAPMTYSQPTTMYSAATPTIAAPMPTYSGTTYATYPTYGTTYVRGYSMAPRPMMRRGPFRWFVRRAY